MKKKIKVAIIDNSINPEVYSPVHHWSKYLKVESTTFSAKKGMLLAIEIKTSRQNVFYIQKEQIEGLQLFADRIGAQSYVAVKFVGKRMDYMFLSAPDSLTQSKGGSYRVAVDDLKNQGIDFYTLILTNDPVAYLHSVIKQYFSGIIFHFPSPRCLPV